MGFSSACLKWLWVLLLFLLAGALRKTFVPVVALAEGVGAGEVCPLTSSWEREDVVHHLAQTAIAEMETHSRQSNICAHVS